MNVSIVIPTGQLRSKCIACINSTADDDKSTFELLINGGRRRFLQLVEETAEDNETPYLWLLPVCSILVQSQKHAKNLFFFSRSLPPSGSHLFIFTSNGGFILFLCRQFGALIYIQRNQNHLFRQETFYFCV